METKEISGFNGFNFITPAKNIIIDKSECGTYNGLSYSNRHFSETDTYFNDDMIKCDLELNALLNSL